MTVLGLTFKENVVDVRNSQVFDIIREFESFGVSVQVHDPVADSAAALKEYGVTLQKEPTPADAVVLAVAHESYRTAGWPLITRLLAIVPAFIVVGQAGSGAEALRMVTTTRPDLLLLDIYLPDISGLEVMRAVREAGVARVDIIAITAARDVESLRAAMHGGVVHYLIKPFRFTALQEKLRCRELWAMGANKYRNYVEYAIC